MRTNYKFGWVSRKDDVHIDSCLIRFFEGNVTTENEKNFHGELIPATKYRILNKIKEVIYTEKDFGVISSDDELKVFLNGELKKDKKREPIEEQKSLDIALVK